MSEGLFVIVVVVLLAMYITRDGIINFINTVFLSEERGIQINDVGFNYLLVFIGAITLVMGMLIGKDTHKEKYGNISEGFEKHRSKASGKDEDRPSPMFDINTYW